MKNSCPLDWAHGEKRLVDLRRMASPQVKSNLGGGFEPDIRLCRTRSPVERHHTASDKMPRSPVQHVSLLSLNKKAE